VKVKKLYHYTCRTNLFGIAVNGLTPNKYEPPTDLLTMGLPVVWLTTQESLTPTAADLEHMRRHDKDAERFKEATLLERDTRITVNLSTLSRRLVHWVTWLSTTNRVLVDAENPDDTTRHITGRDVLQMFPPTPTAKKHYWIYFGTIKPARIDLRPTPETMLPGIESNIASALEEGDADRVAQLSELRDQIRGFPFGTRFRFNVQDETEAA